MTPSPDTPPPGARAQVEGHELLALSDGWQAASSEPDAHADPSTIAGLDWIAACVPGTAAGALRDAGTWRHGDPRDLDAEDWWFRTSFDAQPLAAGEAAHLCLDGIATVAEVFLNGELVLESDSMFAAHALEVTDRLREHNELTIRCRALGPLLGVRRRPRARWRTRLVSDGNLRFFRTMLLGRCPGIAPGPPAVGPWRAVRLERRRQIDVAELALRPRVDGGDGFVSVLARMRCLDGSEIDAIDIELSGPTGSHRERLTLAPASGRVATESVSRLGASPGGVDDHVSASGALRVPSAARWWPHTHGEPALYEVRLVVHLGVRTIGVDGGRVGFRELAFGARPGHDVEHDGLDLHVNGVRVFARGAVWTPIDPVAMAPAAEELREALAQVRDAGMNMLRLPGTGAYETRAFHDLCDELGILVWQDFMFANLDYPLADERFRATVVREAASTLTALGGRPSLAVLCGNSEVEQQVAMTGLDAALGRGELFGKLLLELVRDSGIDAVYIPTAPCGGDLPFRTDCGIGTYYGVGCYRLPLEDARRAEVRFAGECLAFSHVPAQETIEGMSPVAPERLVGHHPAWKAGIPRENGADWDFEDIRDHYLRLLFGVDADELRWVDHERYLELSRTLTGEILAEVFGEWRRSASPCGGGLILWLRDLWPGAGWGMIDHRGTPKLAYRHLARALAPVAVWTVDEQLGGIVAHVANDSPEPLSAFLRVALYREREHVVEQARVAVELAAHSQQQWNIERVVGRFLDAGWTYRFGPCGHDTIAVTLETDSSDDDHADTGERILSQALRFPAGRPLDREPPERLGLAARAHTEPDGSVRLTVSSTRVAYSVAIHAPGFVASDDGFSLEPGGARTVTLRPHAAKRSLQDARIGAVNMSGRVKIAHE
jgi:beta-mannosidase